MEKTIIQGIKRLRVLTPYDYDNMDELAQDLSNALEESSHRLSPHKVKKGRAWKRRSKSTGSLAILGSSVPKSSAVSEDSESSLDDQIRPPMEMSTNGSQPQSDSDDVPKSTRYNHQSTSWRHCAVNMGESDSVNENFHPSREPRRKRKFKRMAVDPQPIVEPELRTLSCVPLFSQKPRRIRSLKSVKNKQKLSKLCDVDIENVCSGFAETASGFCGKRKRSIRERSIECNGYDECHEIIPGRLGSDGTQVWPNTGHIMEYDGVSGKKIPEVSSSGLSSSESDCGILTNDEGREADDEHSDFFHEPGPACGIPGITAWWEEERLLADNTSLPDPKFEAILSGSFRYMSETAKQMYRLQVSCHEAGRQIRAGRRRLEKAAQPASAIAEEKTSCVIDHSSKKDHTCLGLYHDQSLGKTAINVIKRRRRMPPIPSALHGCAADSFDPIPESNIGSRMLQNMGWEPGTGLGPGGGGIKSPLKALSRVKNRGLGYGNCPEVILGSQAPPPPPPPSPQPFNVSNGEFSGDFGSLASPSIKPLEGVFVGSVGHAVI